MKKEEEIGSDIIDIPQIEKFLGTRLDKSGERLYKIAWKTTWLSASFLNQYYKDQIEEFWREHKKLMNPLHLEKECTTSKQAENYVPEEKLNKRTSDREENARYTNRTCKEGGKEEFRENATSQVTAKSDYQEDDHELSRQEAVESTAVAIDDEENNTVDEHLFTKTTATEESIMHCKRKPNWNLEDIVLKLKKSKTPDDDDDDATSTGSMSPRQNEADFDDDDYENLSSPVYPKYPYVDEKFFSQKSSFLTQLEQKDDLDYLRSFKQKSPLPSDTIDNERDDSVSSNDGDNNTDGDNASNKDASNDDVGGDEQLNRLLEEEVKMGGDDKIPETRCKKCNKKFYRRTQLIRHLSNHVMHECVHCKAIFYCVKKYKKHMSTHETYPCEFCNQEFYDASAWYQHRAKHTMVECNSCDMVFYNKTALTKHKFEHLEYICPLCHLSLENLHYWIAHKNQHARDNTLRLHRGNSSFLSPVMACRICHISFITQDVFLKHKCPGKSKKHIQTKTNLPPKLISPAPKDRSLTTTGFRMREIRMNRSPYRPPHHHHYRHHRILNKKDINELIGIDHTLACS